MRHNEGHFRNVHWECLQPLTPLVPLVLLDSWKGLDIYYVKIKKKLSYGGNYTDLRRKHLHQHLLFSVLDNMLSEGLRWYPLIFFIFELPYVENVTVYLSVFLWLKTACWCTFQSRFSFFCRFELLIYCGY